MSSETGKTKYTCRVRRRDQASSLETVIIEAKNLEEVIDKLHRDGYLVISTEIAQAKQNSGLLGKLLKKKTTAFEQSELASEEQLPPTRATKKKSAFQLQIFSVVSTRELISFAVQLATLLKAGVPLMRSLQICARGTKNEYFKSVLQGLIDNVGNGFSFSYTITQYPKVFPAVWANLVEVGEASGNLPEVLEEVANYQEAVERIKGKVVSALFYPSILIFFASCAIGFLLLKIIPKFESIFESMDMTLPVLTQIVIMASKVLRNYFPVVIGLIFFLIGAIIFSGKTKNGKIIFDYIKLKVPIFGPLILQVSVVRCTRSLKTLIKAGVPILQSIEIAGRLTENAIVEAALEEAREGIRVGRSLGVLLESSGLFPSFMTQLIAVGEESGELERFLTLIANYYEERVDTFLSRLSTLIEPLLLVVVGSIIGVLVVAMFLPMIEISTGAHG